MAVCMLDMPPLKDRVVLRERQFSQHPFFGNGSDELFRASEICVPDLHVAWPTTHCKKIIGKYVPQSAGLIPAVTFRANFLSHGAVPQSTTLVYMHIAE